MTFWADATVDLVGYGSIGNVETKLTFSAFVGHLAAPDESFRLAAAVRVELAVVLVLVLVLLVLLQVVLVLQMTESGQPLVLLVNGTGGQDVALVAAQAAQFEGTLHGRVPPLFEFGQVGHVTVIQREAVLEDERVALHQLLKQGEIGRWFSYVTDR